MYPYHHLHANQLSSSAYTSRQAQLNQLQCPKCRRPLLVRFLVSCKARAPTPPCLAHLRYRCCMVYKIHWLCCLLSLVPSPLSLKRCSLPLDNLGLLQCLLQQLCDAGADRLDLLDQVLGVSRQELGSGLELVLEGFGLDVSLVPVIVFDNLTISSASICFSPALDLTQDSIVSAGRPALPAESLSCLTSSSTSPGAGGVSDVHDRNDISAYPT